MINRPSSLSAGGADVGEYCAHLLNHAFADVVMAVAGNCDTLNDWKRLASSAIQRVRELEAMISVEDRSPAKPGHVADLIASYFTETSQQQSHSTRADCQQGGSDGNKPFPVIAKKSGRQSIRFHANGGLNDRGVFRKMAAERRKIIASGEYDDAAERALIAKYMSGKTSAIEIGANTPK